jgi:hydroxymethylglutaryl-CoA lyase
VVAGFRRKPDVRYTVLWLNERGLERALAAEGVFLKGSIGTAASETFMKLNQNRGFADNIRVQHNQFALYKQHGIRYFRGSMMAAFGCNFEGDVPVSRVLEQAEVIQRIAEENEVELDILSLADTMAWATPQSIKRVVGAVRERWPDLRITLHLHDTRGLGCANAYAGLEMGVDSFDSSVAGLGGCPFAGHKGAAGNICTEDLAFMCAEMGIDTGVDLERLLEAARLAEDIVGHDLPGKVKWGGSLSALRAKLH